MLYLCDNQALLNAVKRCVGEGGKATLVGAPDADILLEAANEELRLGKTTRATEWHDRTNRTVFTWQEPCVIVVNDSVLKYLNCLFPSVIISFFTSIACFHLSSSRVIDDDDTRRLCLLIYFQAPVTRSRCLRTSSSADPRLTVFCTLLFHVAFRSS